MTIAPVERRRRRRRRRWPAVVVPLLLIVVVFALGIALGEALHDNPKPGGTQTLVRTLTPQPLVPVPATASTTSTVSKP